MEESLEPQDALPVRLTHCLSCGATGCPNDNYCPCCGARMVRACPACGSEIHQPIAYYCSKCGVPLSGAAHE